MNQLLYMNRKNDNVIPIYYRKHESSHKNFDVRKENLEKVLSKSASNVLETNNFQSLILHSMGSDLIFLFNMTKTDDLVSLPNASLSLIY